MKYRLRPFEEVRRRGKRGMFYHRCPPEVDGAQDPALPPGLNGRWPEFACYYEPVADKPAEGRYDDLYKAGQADSTRSVYMAIAGGHKVYLEDPKPTDFQPRRTAYALSNVRRYSGNYGSYSVAQHAVLVSETVGRLGGTIQQQFAGLHHDDVESVTGDIPQPLKAVCPRFKEIERDIEVKALQPRYNIDVDDPLVREADRIVFCAEVRVLVPEEHQHLYGDYGNPQYQIHLQPSWTDLELWSPDEAYKRYLEAHHTLDAARER